MTENELRSHIVNTAVSYVGYNEIDGSHKKIIDIYNSIKPLPVGYLLRYNDSWCAGYVSAVAHKCGMTDIIFPECGCERMIELYKKKGRWQERDSYVPQFGDIIFYDWDDNGVGDNVGFSDHVGIIVSVTNNSIKVVEGNIADKVSYRTISVNAKYIRGYGLPDYKSKATSQGTSTQVVSPTPVPSYFTIKLPQLSRGSKGNSVRALQILLIGYGYNCGIHKDDGDFGSDTVNAVLKYQKDNRLHPDGIVGKDTWSKLLLG